jgi:hypothetical protein
LTPKHMKTSSLKSSEKKWKQHPDPFV